MDQNTLITLDDHQIEKDEEKKRQELFDYGLIDGLCYVAVGLFMYLNGFPLRSYSLYMYQFLALAAGFNFLTMIVTNFVKLPMGICKIIEVIMVMIGTVFYVATFALVWMLFSGNNYDLLQGKWVNSQGMQFKVTGNIVTVIDAAGTTEKITISYLYYVRVSGGDYWVADKYSTEGGTIQWTNTKTEEIRCWVPVEDHVNEKVVKEESSDDSFQINKYEASAEFSEHVSASNQAKGGEPAEIIEEDENTVMNIEAEEIEMRSNQTLA